jgi:hypothetical protein
MKRNVRKLRLDRETVSRLGQNQTAAVAGAGETYEFISGCACTDTCACPTTGGGGGGYTQTCPSYTWEFISGCATNCG